MMCIRCLLLLLFLLPMSVNAKSNEKACKKRFTRVDGELKLAEASIQQYESLPKDQIEKRIEVLKDAVTYTQRAIFACGTIITKAEKHLKKDWAPSLKAQAETELSKCNELIQELNNAISYVLYEKGLKKASLAKESDHSRRLNNIDEVLARLNAAAQLYDQAASDAYEAFVTPASEDNKQGFLKFNQDCKEKANQFRKDAIEWPANVVAQKAILKERLALLKEEMLSLDQNGQKQGALEIGKRIVSIVDMLVESGENELLEELKSLQNRLALYEKAIVVKQVIPQEEFASAEKRRRDLFFKSDLVLRPEAFFQRILKSGVFPCAVPIDGQIAKADNHFELFTGQYYRFFVQSDKPVTHLFVKVYDKGEFIHEEKITLPMKNTLAWESYLTKDGMLFIPETRLKTDYGLDLQLHFVYYPKCVISMVIGLRGTSSDYQFSVVMDEKEVIYGCNFLTSPPWQLTALRKPALPSIDTQMDKSSAKGTLLSKNDSQLHQSVHFPILDQFVEELKRDPLALAEYVQNEISFIDPFLTQKDGVFEAPCIHRNAFMTFLEKHGSPWEQCQLLVYLLRQAGYHAVYAFGEPCAVSKELAEKMLLIQLNQEKISFKYPWVVFFDGQEWIALFPWLKEMQVNEGFNLYSFMPEKYATAERWILHYLQGDERILKHIGEDGDDSAGVLFSRFVEEELQLQGLSLADVGIQRTLLKKQFKTWEDFPRPQIKTEPKILTHLEKYPSLFAHMQIAISSHENPQKTLTIERQFVSLDCTSFPIWFSYENGGCKLHFQAGDGNDYHFSLEASDQNIDIKVTYFTFDSHVYTHTFLNKRRYKHGSLFFSWRNKYKNNFDISGKIYSADR